MKPVLVTGAAKRLGAEICRHLAAKGHDILVHYRNSEEEAKELVASLRAQNIAAKMIYGDFSTMGSLQEFITRLLHSFPTIKGVVHNVGNYLNAGPPKTKNEDWLDLFQTNFFTPLFITQALLPSLRSQKGRIVNIGITGLNTSRPFSRAAAYGNTKCSLWFYTRSLAKDIAKDHVTVNMVSPGILENSIDIGKIRLPMGRVATLHEVARVVAFLFEEDSNYITGQNIEIAGAFVL